MKVELNSCKNINFHAKVSPQLEKVLRSYINQGGNRLKNNYKLNTKIAEFDKYGYDEYTMNLVSKYNSMGNEYSLVVTKEGQNIKDGICLSKKSSMRELVNYFLNIRKNQFINKMENGYIYGG